MSDVITDGLSKLVKNERKRKERYNPFRKKEFVCSVCNEPMKYLYGDIYECIGCGNRANAEHDAVKAFLEENGAATAVEISEKTGIPLNNVTTMLKDGKLEIPKNSPIKIKCEKCGADITSGRLCYKCENNITEVTTNMRKISGTVGVKVNQPATKGRMHTKNLHK